MKNQQYQPSIAIVKSVGDQIREIVECQMRHAALNMVYELFNNEVEQLCGDRFSRKGTDGYYRGGSESSSVLIQGQRVEIKKPRVRRDEGEVHLETYSALKNYDILCERVMKHMMSGVSTRDYEPLLDEVAGGLGLKKTSVSKAFKKASKESLDEMNSRDLSMLNLISLMIDGVGFGDMTVIVVLGIDAFGKKHILGLRQAETENWEVCRDLFESLIDRGLKVTDYLFVIDGAKALKKSIRKIFGKKSPVQRCIRHKERNIVKYLPKERHKEFYRRWKKLHGLHNYQDALSEYKVLVSWLGNISHAALSSLEEAELETLTTAKLGLPSILRKTLSSTNPIESAFSIAKPKLKRVKNWKSSPDQVGRWSASVLLEAENKFRKIRGHKEIPILIEELKKLSVENQEQVA